MSGYGHLSDAELVERLNTGDKTAFTIIYNKYFDVLYIHACNKLRNNVEAEDVVQELFSHLWNKRAEIILRTNLSAYLYTAVRNRILDIFAHEKVKSKYVDSFQKFLDTGYCVTDHLVREKQLSSVIEKEIAELPAKMREVFELSRKHNLSHQEIAEQLNLSKKTIKTQVNNSLKILRSKLKMILFASSLVIVSLFF